MDWMPALNIIYWAATFLPKKEKGLQKSRPFSLSKQKNIYNF